MRSGLTALLALSLLASSAAARAPAPPPEISGIPVVLLVDLGSGQVLEARQPDLSFVPASLTKVMTMYVAIKEMQAGRLGSDSKFTVSEAVARDWRGKGTSLDLAAGQQIDAETLLHGIATVSANDGAMVLAEGYAGNAAAWSALMNGEAKKLGMTNSRFNSPNGWPDGGKTYVSARDLTKLAEAMIRRYPWFYHRYFGKKTMVWNGKVLTSHDPTVGVVPGADGIKTGFTREAGYNFLGSAQRGYRRLVMVVAGARSEEQRAAASRALLEWGFTAWTSQPLFRPGDVVAQARVQNGEARSVPLIALDHIYATVPAGTKEKMSLRVVYQGPIVAPIEKGTPVGELEIRVGNREPRRMPLYAGEWVTEAGPLDRIVNGLMGLFS